MENRKMRRMAMAMERNRKFGEIPLWAKEGPITLENYSLRVELHCKIIGRTEHPTITLGTTECERWRSYFQYHLGGYPQAMWMLIQDQIKEMTVPDLDPQVFDATWCGINRTASLVELPRTPPQAFPPIPPDQGYYPMVKRYGIPVDRPRVVWHSLDDLVTAIDNKTWPDGGRAPHSETPETVRKKFGLSQAGWDALPDSTHQRAP